MNCKEFEKKIPLFLDRKLNFYENKEFIKHYNECNECHEELVINYLVTEGISRLEEGDTFYLQKELDQNINEMKRRVAINERYISVGKILETVLFVTIGLVLIWLII